MNTPREDYLDNQRNQLIESDKLLDRLLKTARQYEGEEGRDHDKELQDAKDMARLAHQQLADLDEGSDEDYARDKEGFERTVRELADILDGVSARLDSDEVGKAPDAQRNMTTRH